MEIEFPAWRLVLEGMATLEEIRTVYTLVDVLKMNALLDMKNDVQEAANPPKKKD